MLTEKTDIRLKKINLFEPGPETPVFIECDCPKTICNYRCSYCFIPNTVGYKPYPEEFAQWKESVRAAVTKIKRPLILSMGPSGEPLVQPEWWEFVRTIVNEPNIRMITFVTNLSRPIEPFLNGMDPKKFGTTATLHPSEFKDPEKDFRAFFDQAVYLKKIGVKFVINFVLTPLQIPDFPKYKRIFAAEGIPMTANLFRGKWEGRTYPEAYTQAELAVMKEYLAETPFIFDYQSHLFSPFGNRCTAGRFAFNMSFDGTVGPCYFVGEKLGSIFDNALYVYDENITCSSHVCECKWTIPLQEHIVADFSGVGNVHEIRKREQGKKGEHPFL